jgi:CDP-4-dehydro-6-deoxyglucose reductase, E1
MMGYKIPLAVSQFDPKDINKIKQFFDSTDRWTQGEKVAEFEKQVCKKLGVPYAVFVSSGSTANTLIAMYYREEIDTVMVPALTWTTGVSPFVHMGYHVEFVDIDMNTLSMNLAKVEAYLIQHPKEKVLIFIPSILGLTPDIYRLQLLEGKYNCRVAMDNCESMLSKYDGNSINDYFLSTTSTYFAHEITSVEGGFVFPRNKEQLDWFIMARSHGLVRTLSEKDRKKYRNPDVNEQFDFNILGNNFRNTDIHAMIGLLDLARLETYTQQRRELSELFTSNLSEKFAQFKDYSHDVILYGFPIIARDGNIEPVIQICEEMGIEYRPVISGNLLRQTCYRGYGVPYAFENTDFVHKSGIYIGCYPGMDRELLKEFLNKINE